MCNNEHPEQSEINEQRNKKEKNDIVEGKRSVLEIMKKQNLFFTSERQNF